MKTETIDIRTETKEAALLDLMETGRALIEGATGVGKTKMALDIVKETGYDTVIVLVPTDTIAESWDKEIEKWLGAGKYPILCVNYRSAHKLNELITKTKRLLVILDEAHHITELNLEYLLRLPKCTMLALSATVDHFKFELLRQLGFKDGIKITIDQAVDHDLIVDYSVSVIGFFPDAVTKNIEAGKKGSKFMVTEWDQIEYLEQRLGSAKANGYKKSIEFAILQRMHFIRNMPSRIRYAKKIIAKIKHDHPSRRLLIFAPTKKVAEELCPECYLHSTSGPEMFDAFKRNEFNHLSSVNMLSEGINVEADMILILSAYSKERATIQQLGRVLRKGKDGKVGTMVILCAKGTQDEKWVESSTAILRNVKRYTTEKLGL